jgi:hypothetical protein
MQIIIAAVQGVTAVEKRMKKMRPPYVTLWTNLVCLKASPSLYHEARSRAAGKTALIGLS